MTKPILAAILSCSGPQLTDEEKFLFSASNPLGITLFARNLQNKEQTLKLVQNIKNVINRDDVLIAVDEEGGRVSRLKHIGNIKGVSAETLGAKPLEYSEMHANLISAAMLDLGMNVNYAPVVDKKTTPQNAVLAGRCFSSDEGTIIQHVEIMAKTYMKNGICPCIKHLPTHFSAMEDPHLFPLKTDLPLNEIKKETAYLKQFWNYPMAMTAHVRINSIDDQFPVTMSEKVIDGFLRGYLNYDGFLLSDAIDMHALHGNVTDRVILSLNAGVDAVCYCSGIYKDLYAICDQKRFMTEKSLIRFAKIKNIIHNPNKHIDVAHIRERYIQSLMTEMEKQYDYDATEILNQMLKKGENL